jgi:hypothetical protein
MLYRFKSQASADFVMLETNARQVLEIIGKSASASGVVTVDQMPAAIAALEAAVAQETQNANHDPHAEEAQHVALRQRAAPLLAMLRESLSEGKDVIWTT